MALSAFDDKASPPQPEQLLATLGAAWQPWEQLQARLAERLAPLTMHWGFTSKSTGWGMRLRQGERTVLYMTPCRGSFLASLALGDKALRAARASDLPAPVLHILDTARRYAEGTGVRLEVREVGDLAAIEVLVACKMDA